jgi:hypothetical protein
MFNKFMQWLVPKLEKRCLEKGLFLNIHGLQDKENVYLVRSFLFRSTYFSVYIHRFLRSDIDDPHDHPFSFLGYIVKGGYNEGLWTRNPNHTGFDMRWQERKAGSWGWRPAKTIHFVKLDQERKMKNVKDAPLTIIFRGPIERDWGFWKNHESLAPRWEIWHKYLGVNIDDIRE